MKKPMIKKLILISFAILIIAIVTGGSIMLHMRGLDGEEIAIVWLLVLVGIIALLDLIFLIIRPIIKSIKGEDDPPPGFKNRASPNV